MATASRRQLIVLEFLNRLSAIKQSEGFQTDAGFRVYLGEVLALDNDDPDAVIALVVRDDIPGRTMENVSITLPMEIQAVAKADINQPLLAAEALIADIKKAIELPDRFLGGLLKERITRSQTRSLPREAGSPTVGISITYLVPYVEAFGRP